jgi:hypothetical protein
MQGRRTNPWCQSRRRRRRTLPSQVTSSTGRLLQDGKPIRTVKTEEASLAPLILPSILLDLSTVAFVCVFALGGSPLDPGPHL